MYTPMAPDVKMCSCCPPWEEMFEKERGKKIKLVVVSRTTPRSSLDLCQGRVCKDSETTDTQRLLQASTWVDQLLKFASHLEC